MSASADTVSLPGEITVTALSQTHPSDSEASSPRAVLLSDEKRIILAFRFVVALVALGFLFALPAEMHVPWQFYLVMSIFLLSNVVFFFENVQTFNSRRAQRYIFAFDIGMLTVLMIYLGLSNKEFYLVFFLTVFFSALSKKTSHAFAISAVMAGLYLVFWIHGKTDVDLTLSSFSLRVVLFFVISSFVGHISEVAEARRRSVSRLTDWKEKAEKLAIEQEKMAAVGLLAAGVAHEFNNLLAGIKGYADLARMDAVPTDELIELVTKQCDQAAGIVKDLLSFSRKRGGTPERTHVPDAVEQVLRLVRKELAVRNIEVERRIEGVPPVMAEPGAIERTTLNLVRNAIQAMDDGGKLGIELSARNGTISLCVTDNGRGMSPEMLDHAFELFYGPTSAEEDGVARATGLGLAVSRQLIERSGGRMEIESSPGSGTTVSVSLPAAPARAGSEGYGDASADVAEASQADPGPGSVD